MKKALLITGLLFVFIQTQAQVKIHMGISTAVNSTFVLDKGLKADPRYLSEATYKWAPVGFSFGIDLGKRFGLQLESIKAAQGQVYQVVDAYKNIVGNRTFDMSYLQLPLLMKFMSGGDGLARFNFQLGPQLSILQKGSEILQYAKSIQEIPDGVTPPEGAVQQPDGTYEVPAVDEVLAGSSDVQGALYSFKNKEIQLAAAMGFDLDITKHFYLSSVIRANYSFTDMRGQDLIESIQNGTLSDISNQRANLAIGVQMALHWMIGGTRHHSKDDK